MKKIITLTLIVFTMLVSCNDQDDEATDNSVIKLQNACTAGNPLEIEWMQNLIAELGCGEYSCRVSIMKTVYEGETVYYSQMTDPVCNGVDLVDLYNCEGEIIAEFNLEASREFINNRRNDAEEVFYCNE